MQRRALGGIRLAFLLLLSAITIIGYADRQIIALLKPVLDAQFGWTPQDYATIATGFQIAVAVSLLGAGWFIDRAGLRWGFAAGLGGWSLAAMLHAAASSVIQFFAARVALGVCESVGTPAGMKAIAAFYPPEQRGVVIGLTNIAPNVAAVITPLAVSALYVALGWQWTIALVGVTGFACLILWLLLPFERLQREAAQHLGDTTLTPTDRAPGRRHAFALGAGKFLTDQAWWFMLFWLPDFFHRRYGLDMRHLGLPIAAVYVMAGFGSLLGGLLPRRIGGHGSALLRARRVVMGIAALLPLPVAAVLHIAGLWPTVLVVGLMLGGHQAFAANLFAVVVEGVALERVGAVIGFGAFCGNVGGALSLMLAGWMLHATGSFQTMFVLCALGYPAAWLVLQGILPLAPKRRPG